MKDKKSGLSSEEKANWKEFLVTLKGIRDKKPDVINKIITVVTVFVLILSLLINLFIFVNFMKEKQPYLVLTGFSCPDSFNYGTVIDITLSNIGGGNTAYVVEIDGQNLKCFEDKTKLDAYTYFSAEQNEKFNQKYNTNICKSQLYTIPKNSDSKTQFVLFQDINDTKEEASFNISYSYDLYSYYVMSKSIHSAEINCVYKKDTDNGGFLKLIQENRD